MQTPAAGEAIAAPADLAVQEVVARVAVATMAAQEVEEMMVVQVAEAVPVLQVQPSQMLRLTGRLVSQAVVSPGGMNAVS